MTPLLGRTEKAPAPLIERIESLDRATDALDGIAPTPDVAAARELLERIDRRRALSAEHTVIGLFGATGTATRTEPPASCCWTCRISTRSRPPTARSPNG